MEFTIKQLAPLEATADCLLLPVQGDRLGAAAAEVDAALGGLLARLASEGDLAAKPGSTLLFPVAGNAFRKILLVQMGKEGKDRDVREAARAAARALLGANAASAAVFLAGLKKIDANDALAELVQAIMTAGYRAGQFKSKPEPASKLAHLTVALGKKDEHDKAEAALARGLAIGHGVNFARELADLPGNVCTPQYLADTAQAMARVFGFKCESHDEKQHCCRDP